MNARGTRKERSEWHLILAFDFGRRRSNDIFLSERRRQARSCRHAVRSFSDRYLLRILSAEDLCSRETRRTEEAHVFVPPRFERVLPSKYDLQWNILHVRSYDPPAAASVSSSSSSSYMYYVCLFIYLLVHFLASYLQFRDNLNSNNHLNTLSILNLT